MHTQPADNSTFSQPLKRLPRYIGREQIKHSLAAYARQTIELPACHVLYFEGEGGLGKTRLLQLCPLILEELLGPEAARLRMCEIVDFYSFQNRVPLVIESQLIDGLKQTAASEAYRLPAEQIDSIFADYARERITYLQARERRDDTDLATLLHHLRTTFVACWNRLSQQHPLIIAFDTLETLFFEAPAESLVNTGIPSDDAPPESAAVTAGLELVAAWMHAVLPHLQHTLVLLSGRPVPLPLQENWLVERLTEWDLLREEVYRLQRFESPAAIRAYLEAYNCTVANDQDIAYIRQITDGRPLLLTCYAETRRDNHAMPPGLPDLDRTHCTSRPAFEDWLIATLLNPVAAADPTSPRSMQQNTLAYCLYFLVYARRGIRVDQLKALFAELASAQHDQGDLPYDAATVEQLGQVALVKQNADVLFLHDEIFVMIDSSRKPDQLGLREAVLEFLCRTSAATVRATSAAAASDTLLGRMADHMYYELTRQLVRGYWLYAVYSDRLLENRDQNAVLVLSDAFWRTLSYGILADGTWEYPYMDALADADLVSRAQILRDEQVRYVELLRVQGAGQAALHQAQHLFQHYSAAGAIPAANTRETVAAVLEYPDLYLFVNLSLKLLFSEIITGPPDLSQSERLCNLIIDLLGERGPAPLPAPLLHLRRMFFLGTAYAVRNQLRSIQRRFDEALDDGKRAVKALEAYSQQPATTHELNDNVLAALAQTMNNLAYDFAQRGNFKAALLLSDKLTADRGDYINHLPDYRRVLIYNTRALIHIMKTDYTYAERPLKQAEALLENVQNQRLHGLVLFARIQLEIARMKANQERNEQIEQQFVAVVGYLAKNTNQLPEVYDRWASYQRHLAALCRAQGDQQRAAAHLQRALDLLDAGLPFTAATGDSNRADLLTSKAAILNIQGHFEQAAALLQQAENLLATVRASSYAQIVSGRIALQYADIALHHRHDYQAALRYMTIALARIYVFAEYHRDQETFERVIDQFLAEVPRPELDVFHAQRDTLDLQVDDLPYQRPDPGAWRGAWRRSLRTINASIEYQREF